MKSYSSYSQAKYSGILEEVRGMVRGTTDQLPDLLPHRRDSSRVSQRAQLERKIIRMKTALEKSYVCESKYGEHLIGLRHQTRSPKNYF